MNVINRGLTGETYETFMDGKDVTSMSASRDIRVPTATTSATASADPISKVRLRQDRIAARASDTSASPSMSGVAME